jgi:hypothetical protein
MAKATDLFPHLVLINLGLIINTIARIIIPNIIGIIRQHIANIICSIVLLFIFYPILQSFLRNFVPNNAQRLVAQPRPGSAVRGRGRLATSDW